MPKKKNVFQKMVSREMGSGGYPTRKARVGKKWLFQKAREAKTRILTNSRFKTAPPTVLARQLQTSGSLKNRIMIGHMFMFIYEPKLKQSLPYYDRFPLVFPIEDYSNGFLGINLHYLDPTHRAILMDALYQTASDERYDEKTRLKLSYELLSGVSKYRYFRPCIKRYLTTNVVSRFIKIESKEWDNALFLPTERFEKATRRTVWQDSKNEILKY